MSTPIKTKKDAAAIVHSLSQPSKMPCPSYGLPAAECSVGSMLRVVHGSTCSDCYACKGRYAMPNVKAAQYARLTAIRDPLWVPAMVKMLEGHKWFRWHDSGDIQDADHFESILKVVEQTPWCRHWLPTREKQIVLNALAKRTVFPDNLTIRISATMIDGLPSKMVADVGLNTSSVHDKQPPIGFECSAPKNAGYCGDCRACWDQAIPNVSYHRH